MGKIFSYSGGYDSTWMVYDYLINQENNSIDCITFSCDLFSIEKQAEERKRQYKFIEYMKTKGKVVNIKTIRIDFNRCRPNGNTTQQAALMIPMLAMVSSDEEEINLGIIKGDDFWYDKHLHESVLKSLSDLLKKKLTLVYPLIGIKKYDIIDAIVKNDLEQFVWTCENPTNNKVDFRECGYCVPCNNKTEAKYILKMKSEEYKNNPLDIEVKEKYKIDDENVKDVGVVENG